MNALKQIMTEFDIAKNDASWDEDHPIFKMAAEIDSLKKELNQALDILDTDARAHLLAEWASEVTNNDKD